MEEIVLSGWGIAASIATITAAVIAIISLIYIARQAGAVREQVERMREQTDVVRKQKKVDRAHDYLKRYGDLNFRLIIAEAINFLKREDMSLEDKWKILEDKEDPKHVDLKSKVVYTLNFFDELAIMYNRDLIDQEIIKEAFKDPSKYYKEYAARYITRRRKEISNVYVEWEKMNNDFQKA